MPDMRSELSPFLDQDGRLLSLPARHKKKLLALWYLAERIDAGRQYTEPEINDLLDEWTVFRDHATLRRELYNKRLLNRTEDGTRQKENQYENTQYHSGAFQNRKGAQ